MRKFKLFACGLCLLCVTLITGCKKEKSTVDVFADVDNATVQLNTSKNDPLTVGDVYEFIRKEQNSEIVKRIFTKIMADKLDLENDEVMENLYKELLNEKFNKLFVENESKAYHLNDKFAETVLVDYLKSETYNISCEGNFDSYLEAPFTCDYSDYIEKELNYDIYTNLLKVKYILEEKESLLDKSKARNISYYYVSVNSSDVGSVREEMENYVLNLADNYNSTDPEDIKNIEDIAKDKRKKDFKVILDEYNKISSADDSNFTYLNKFTTCGNYKCSKEEGREYLESKVAEYYTSEVVFKDNTSVLYESARNILFSDNVEDYLYKIGDDLTGYKSYLISPVYANDSINSLNDIILFNNVSGSLGFYLVEVEVIDSNSTNEINKAKAAELLIDKVNINTVMKHYFKESKIKIYDKEIRDLFISTYGDYSVE